MAVRSEAKRLAARAVRAASLAVDRVRTIPPGVVILIYHRVGGTTPVSVDLPVAMFREQMEYLAASGRVLSLDDALAWMRGEAHQHLERPVVITFDDGTRDWADLAMPILAEYGLPATFYVATAFVEEQRPFPNDGQPVSWAALRDMASTGLATIGSHTHTHLVLRRATSAETRDEIDRSQALVGEHLGLRCDHFAYPKAVPGSPAAEGVVRATFVTAAVAGNRTNGPTAQLHRLGRTAVQRADAGRWFRAKAHGGLQLEGRLRERMAG
jgi:hypothetical protein